MQCALNRAYQRLQGKHPRRPKSSVSWIASLATDAVLVVAATMALAGALLIVLAFWGQFQLTQALGGAALVALAVPLLYLWERLAWEPVLKRLSKLS